MSTKKANPATKAKKGKSVHDHKVPAAKAKEEAKKGATDKAAPIPKHQAAAKPKKVSALDAAAKVLSEAGAAMNCQELIEAMAQKGYWTSPGGKTPQATLYSAMAREIKMKGNGARFTKTERGKFALGKAS